MEPSEATEKQYFGWRSDCRCEECQALKVLEALTTGRAIRTYHLRPEQLVEAEAQVGRKLQGIRIAILSEPDKYSPLSYPIDHETI